MRAAWVLAAAIAFACGGGGTAPEVAVIDALEVAAIDASEVECRTLGDEWFRVASSSRACEHDVECIVVGGPSMYTCNCDPAIGPYVGVNEATYASNGGPELADRIRDSGCMKFLARCHAPYADNLGCVSGSCREEIPSCYPTWDAPPFDASPDGTLADAETTDAAP